MNSNRPSLKIWLICGCLLAANGLLQFMADKDLGIGWPHNVIRNWEQVGWSALKGRLISNPGGHDVLQSPTLYVGHRATSLYPAFLVGRLFSWTGSHAMPFHVLSTLLVLVSVWHLLGRSETALFIGGLAILCPGFIIWPTILDPNTNSVLAGILYSAMLWWCLRKPLLTRSGIALVVILTLAFSCLNWTTALVHAQVFVALWALGLVNWRRLALYAFAAALAAVAVVATSIASKFSGTETGSGRFLEMLAGYTWGSGGYSNGQSAAILLARVAFINAVGLFPFWIVWGWFWVRLARQRPMRAALALAPLVVAACEVAAMRNYFCHHPWMAAPVFLLGGVLSLFGVFQETASDSQVPGVAARLRPAAWPIGLAGAFCFSFIVVLSYHEHQARVFSLVSLVRGSTARSDVIAVTSSMDSSSGDLKKRWPEMLDRWVLPIDLNRLQGPKQPVAASYLLSSAPLETGWPMVARSEADSAGSWRVIQESLKWFTKHVSRRNPGDRLELAETYYLYRLPAELVATATNGGSSLPGPGGEGAPVLSKP